MHSPRPRPAAADHYWMFGLAVGLPLLAMAMLGLDSNWDLRNYHLYNPHAWLSGRDAIDIAPAQLQSWHNPLLDLPLYLLVSSGLPARWASAWLTLPTMVALYCLLCLQTLLGPSPPSRIAQVVLALMALTGAATYSTLGLSMNDGFVAAALLASLLLLTQAQAGTQLRPWLLAGLLAGAITGLKLSAAFYCLALAASVLASGEWRQKLRRLATLALGGGAGFLLTYAWWGWRQFKAHGNPFFPYYNNLFHSSDALANAYADARFRPTSVVDGLLAPVQLLHRSRHFSEFTLSDPRLLLGLLALAGLWLLYRRRLPADAVLRARTALMLAFFVSAAALWVGQYGIYRYAIVLELLGALAVVVLLQCLPRGAAVALPLALLLVSADTKRPDWGHAGASQPMAGIVPAALPANALVVIASDEPLAYLALGLPASVPLVAVSNNLMSPRQCTRLQDRAQRLIAGHDGPLWLLNDTGPDSGKAQPLLTTYYGLQPAGACIAWVNGLAPAQLCRQRRSGPVMAAQCSGQGAER